MADRIRYYYNRGLYTLRHIAAFVAAGVLTQEEADNITGG